MAALGSRRKEDLEGAAAARCAVRRIQVSQGAGSPGLGDGRPYVEIPSFGGGGSGEGERIWRVRRADGGMEVWKYGSMSLTCINKAGRALVTRGA